MTNQVRLMRPTDADYPRLLREIHDPPDPLYVRGQFDFNARLSVAVVGSRRATAYGRVATEQIVKPLARAGIVIVSGLAFGIDGAAHTAALDSGGLTIAVLGTPITRIYPFNHQTLAKRILTQSGAIVSEVPPGGMTHRGSFPKRNRIIAGLCQAVVVVEAALDSGSLITARLALEENRDVFAIPGPITSPFSMGTHALIKAGATPLTTAQDLLDFYQITARELDPRAVLTSLQEKILEVIPLDQPIHIDKLVESATINLPELQGELTFLELHGSVRMVRPGMYIRT